MVRKEILLEGEKIKAKNQFKELNELRKTNKISKTEFIKRSTELISKENAYLTKHVNRNLNTKPVNHKLYHLLEKPFTIINAYTKISKNKGALTKGFNDENIMNFFGKANAELICKKLKTKNYQWQPVRKTWIPKPGKSKLRPIDTPTQENRIVQEAIRGILEAIYEPVFKEFEKMTDMACTNLGFRIGKGTWTALNNIKMKTRSPNFDIEGDIVSAYNSVDHDILMKILSIRIKDKHFLKLISNLLKTGVMAQHKLEHNLSFLKEESLALYFSIFICLN